MMAEPAPDMLSAALAAWDAGLCVVKARADGTKRPDGTWLEYQAERPSRNQVAAWFRDGWPAMGVVCGAVSGDLEMFELEGRFVAEIGTTVFGERMKAAGLDLLLRRLTKEGMLTISPSDGRHLVYRVQGAVAGNTKLAVRKSTDAELAEDPKAPTKTLIETRGEGGFVMLAPSHGAAHPTGKPWKITAGSYANIPTITAEERDALWEVARSFQDETAITTPPPPPASRKVVVPRHGGGVVVGPSYFDAVTEHLKATTSVRQILEAHGWTYEYTDRHGRDMLKRPGKTTDGISGSINDSGRLIVFTTSTSFTAYSGPGTKTPTYNELDVLAMYEYGNDTKAAAKAVAEQAGIMDAWKRAKDAELQRDMDALTKPQPVVEARGVNTDTGEIVRPPDVTDDSLWSERECLAHILQAARSRLVGPYAVLGCVLARVAAFTPPSTCLPGIVGSSVPLSLYIALRAPSGGGKSSPAACAADLAPHVPPGCVGPLALGSGEGAVEAYMELVEKEDGGGKKTKVKTQTKHGALFMLDEGQMLAEIGSRKGSTILPVLRTAWSGGDPGQANASIETRRSLSSGSYAVGLISLWQDKSGAALIQDADGGTPQRFVWLPTTDPGATKNRPAWPGELHWDRPPPIRCDGIWGQNPLALHPDIESEIVDLHIGSKLHGTIEIDPLDAHRILNKEKVAGCLAVLDGRRDINLDDWRIAERIMTISDQQRDWVIAESRRRATEIVSAEIGKAVLKESAVEKSATERALKNAARAAWKCAEGARDGATRRDISRRIAGRDRALVSIDDAIAYALSVGWIGGNDTVGYRAGETRPT